MEVQGRPWVFPVSGVLGWERPSAGAHVARGPMLSPNLVADTYALWHRGAWEARRLHEVPLGLALQSSGAWQCHVRLRWEKRHHHPVLASKKVGCDERRTKSGGDSPHTHPFLSYPVPEKDRGRQRDRGRQSETQIHRQRQTDRQDGQTD